MKVVVVVDIFLALMRAVAVIRVVACYLELFWLYPVTERVQL